MHIFTEERAGEPKMTNNAEDNPLIIESKRNGRKTALEVTAEFNSSLTTTDVALNCEKSTQIVGTRGGGA